MFSSHDWSITLNHRCPNKTSLPSLPYKYLCERERVRGAEHKVQPRVFCRGRGESEVFIKVCSVKYLWVKSRFWWYLKVQWQRITFQITFTGQPHKPSVPLSHTHRLKQVCQEHKEPNNLCFAKTLKALMIYREREAAGQSCHYSVIRKKQTLVCPLMNRNSWLTTKWENSALFTAVIYSVWFESHPMSLSHSLKWA